MYAIIDRYTGLLLDLCPTKKETALLCNDVSHWLGASLTSALIYKSCKANVYYHWNAMCSPTIRMFMVHLAFYILYFWLALPYLPVSLHPINLDYPCLFVNVPCTTARYQHSNNHISPVISLEAQLFDHQPSLCSPHYKQASCYEQ